MKKNYNEMNREIEVSLKKLQKISKKKFIFIDYTEIKNGRCKWVRMPMMKWKQAEKALCQMVFWAFNMNVTRNQELIYKNICVSSENALDVLVPVKGKNDIFITKRESRFGPMYQEVRDTYLKTGEYTDFYGEQRLFLFGEVS